MDRGGKVKVRGPKQLSWEKVRRELGRRTSHYAVWGRGQFLLCIKGGLSLRKKDHFYKHPKHTALDWNNTAKGRNDRTSCKYKHESNGWVNHYISCDFVKLSWLWIIIIYIRLIYQLNITTCSRGPMDKLLLAYAY